MSTHAPPRPGTISTGSAPFGRSIKVPQPRTPFIDPTTGGPSREWLYYLQALWDRTGQASGVAPYVSIGGDTMTGPLVLPGDPTTPDEAANKAYVDANSAGGIGDAPRDGDAYGRRDAAWYEVLPIAGGVLEGPLTLFREPVQPMEAATKEYVDANAGGGGGIPEAPSNSLTYGRFNATWAQVLNLQYGGIVQGPMQLLTAPVLPTDAATKGYVDAAIAGGGDWVDAPSDGNAWGRRNATWVQVLPLAGGTLTGSLTAPSFLISGNAQPTGFFAASGNLYVMVDNVVPWQFSSLGATANLPLTMSGAAITALANPVNPQDAATKAYVDATSALYLPLSGGIVTGEVLSAISPASSDALTTKRYVDAGLADVSITYLPLIGGTLTGPLNLPNGTTAIPALQLGADDGTGLSRSANALVMSAQGATVFATFFNAAQLFQPLYMLNNRIQQLGDPTAATDALNLRTGDARYLAAGAGPFLPLTGGTLSGPLQLPNGTPTAPALGIGAADGTGWYRQLGNLLVTLGGIATWQFTPSVSQTAVNLDMLNHLISNVIDPVAPQDAATKAYVDANAGGGGIPDAPSNGNTYARMNAAWTQVLPIGGGSFTGGIQAPSVLVGTNTDTGFYTVSGFLYFMVGGQTAWQYSATGSIAGSPLNMAGNQITLAPTQVIDGRH